MTAVTFPPNNTRFTWEKTNEKRANVKEQRFSFAHCDVTDDVPFHSPGSSTSRPFPPLFSFELAGPTNGVYLQIGWPWAVWNVDAIVGQAARAPLFF
jgi:hypothetical protein